MISTRNIFCESIDNRLSWWAAIEGAVSLLVASLPVIGGHVIAHWRHILPRSTVYQSLKFRKSFRNKPSVHTQQSTQEMNPVIFPPEAYLEREKTIEIIVSAGSSTLASDSDILEEPVSHLQHFTRMGRRGSNNDLSNLSSNTTTITKEGDIVEEHSRDPLEHV